MEIPIPSGLFKSSLVGLLILVGVSVGIFVFTPSLPDSMVPLSNSGDVIATIAATACGLLCCPGILCFFIEKIRFPMIIIVSFVLLLFLSATCIDHAWKNLSYALAKDKTPEKHLCTITQKGKDGSFDELTFRLKDGKEKEYTIDCSSEACRFYDYVEEGDECVAYILQGGFGVDFIMDMRVRARKH